jgi:hypothetical protein
MNLTDPSFSIWERQPGETAKAYAAFVIYMRLPAQGNSLTRRSLKNAVITLYGEWTQGKQRQFQLWSSKFSWVNRSLAWDDEQSKQVNLDTLEKLKQLNARQIQLAQALHRLAIDRLKAMQPIELTVPDVMMFITNGIRLERQALGEPDISILEKEEFHLIDYSNLTSKELREILAKRISQTTITTNV